MSMDNPWAKHRLGVWLEQAADESLPLWQRVAFVAFGTHRKNRHSPLIEKRGQLAVMLGKPPKRISEAVKEAKRRGWLAGESTPKCLVVPAHWISGGVRGGENDCCPVHIRPKCPPKRPQIPVMNSAKVPENPVSKAGISGTENDVTSTDAKLL